MNFPLARVSEKYKRAVLFFREKKCSITLAHVFPLQKSLYFVLLLLLVPVSSHPKLLQIAVT